MNALVSLAYNSRVILGIYAVGVVFFGTLTVQSFLSPGKRTYIPGLLLIDFAILNGVVRNVFFFHLSPHPARPGGVWRLASALILAWGWVLFSRAWQQERMRQRGSPTRT
jgi:hypothetical protein